MTRSPVTIGNPEHPVPNGWTRTPLIELAKLESGHTPRKTVEAYWVNGTVPWICLQDIRDAHGKILFETKYKTTELGIQNSSARILPEGTVCFSRDISVGFTTIMGLEMATTQHFANWICGPALFNKFLMYALMASRQALTGSGEGSVVKTIYMPALEKFHVALPPLEEQHRIVARIEELIARSKTAKQALQAIPPLLEKFRQSVLAAAFRGDLTADWRGRKSAFPGSLQAEKKAVNSPDVKDNHFGNSKNNSSELPTGWTWWSLGALAKEGPTNGYSPASSPTAVGSKTLKLSATTRAYLILNERTTKRIDEVIPTGAKYWLTDGDLLVQRSNSLDYVGTAAVFHGPDNEFIYPDLMMRLRFEDSNLSQWACNMINCPAAKNFLKERATGTAGNMPKINSTTLKSLPIPVPPRPEMRVMNTLIAECLDFARSLEVNLELLEVKVQGLDQSILAKAFRGELVPQDPSHKSDSAPLECPTTQTATTRTGKPR